MSDSKKQPAPAPKGQTLSRHGNVILEGTDKVPEDNR